MEQTDFFKRLKSFNSDDEVLKAFSEKEIIKNIKPYLKDEVVFSHFWSNLCDPVRKVLREFVPKRLEEAMLLSEVGGKGYQSIGFGDDFGAELGDFEGYDLVDY